MSQGKKHPAPPRVRGKVGPRTNRTTALDVGQQYISGQPQGDPGNKLGSEIQEVVKTRTNLVALLGTRSDLQAKISKNAGDIVTADVVYGVALTAYAGAAAALSAGDASLLAVLGVAEVQKPIKVADEVIAAPVLEVKPGEAEGHVVLRCARVAHAGAYLFQYKLEPSQPSDPWLGNVVTKLVSTTVPGLSPHQPIRARAQAIGAEPGPWSEEVVGKAK